jgi:hypothetical protein
LVNGAPCVPELHVNGNGALHVNGQAAAHISHAAVNGHATAHHAVNGVVHIQNGHSNAVNGAQHGAEEHMVLLPPQDQHTLAAAGHAVDPSGAQQQPQGGDAAAPSPAIPQPILVISFVSATLTMASCVFNTLLPIYMVTELKLNMRSMGVFDGLMEAFSYVVRMFSGAWRFVTHTHCTWLPELAA